MKLHLTAMMIGAALLLTGGGCIFWQNSVRETAEFDPVSGDRGKEAPVPVFYGVFRNVSGSGRRFMIRRENGQVGNDEYIRWLDSPELLMERAFFRWMPSPAAKSEEASTWRVSCTLTRFDFEHGAAVAAADFELRNSRTTRVVHAEYRVPVAGDSPAAMTAAMRKAMEQCVEEVRRSLSESGAEEKK